MLNGCKVALRTLDFSQVKPTIAMLRERRARAPEAAWARFPWCDRKAMCACFAVTHLRYYAVMGPWKQRSFHRYSYYGAISVTHSVISLVYESMLQVMKCSLKSVLKQRALRHLVERELTLMARYSCNS